MGEALTDLDEMKRRYADLDETVIGDVGVFEAILRVAERLPRKTAIVELLEPHAGGATREITYSELADGIVRRANAFRRLGVAWNEAVIFLPPQSIDSLLAFWALHGAAAPAPTNAFLGANAIAEIARGCGARAIVSGPAGGSCGTFDLARAVMASAPDIRHHLVIGGAVAEDAADLSRLAADEDGSILLGGAPDLDDIGAFFPTGGTTGTPKIAMLSNRNLLVGALSTAHVTSLDEDHVVPAGLPLFHVGGGVIGTTRAMLLGHTLVLLTPVGYRSPEVVRDFWAHARAHGFTQIITVPTAFSDLLRAYDGEPHGIRFATAGASKLPASLVDDYRNRLGIDLLEGYGMTECSGFCAANPLGQPPRAGSGGIQSPLYRFRIVRLDDDHRYLRDCAPGEWGNIAVSGPGVFLGYTDKRLTAEKVIDDMPDGERWIDAGDLGEVDDDGYLFVVGRAKDLIIRGGHNIDPAPIEEALLSHVDVLDAAAVGMPDARVGELPIAFVQLVDGCSLDEDDLRRHCGENVPDRAGVPVLIVALPELPRTAMRKIFKPELRRQAIQLVVDGLEDGLVATLETSGQVVIIGKPDMSEETISTLDRLNLNVRQRSAFA